MHAMVEQLRTDKQNHSEAVERLTLKQLREKVSAKIRFCDKYIDFGHSMHFS